MSPQGRSSVSLQAIVFCKSLSPLVLSRGGDLGRAMISVGGGVGARDAIGVGRE